MYERERKKERERERAHFSFDWLYVTHPLKRWPNMNLDRVRANEHQSWTR